jgi:hypothetical protein
MNEEKLSFVVALSGTFWERRPHTAHTPFGIMAEEGRLEDL